MSVSRNFIPSFYYIRDECSFCISMYSRKIENEMPASFIALQKVQNRLISLRGMFSYSESGKSFLKRNEMNLTEEPSLKM